MNTHPIDPTKPRTGYLVTIRLSAGSVAKYARDDTELDEILAEARGRRTIRGIEVKAVADDA